MGRDFQTVLLVSGVFFLGPGFGKGEHGVGGTVTCCMVFSVSSYMLV